MIATRRSLCLTWTLFVVMPASRVLEARLTETTRHLQNKNTFIEEEVCQTDNSGNFGKSTSHNVSILYTFEMDILVSGESSSILPAFENKLSALLLPDCFHECHRSGLRIKSNLNSRASEDITGISATPEDNETGACGVSSIGTKCLSIEGGLTIYLNETYVFDATESIALVEEAFNTIMENEEITSAHPDLVSLTFVNAPELQKSLLDRKTHTLHVATSLPNIGDHIYTFGWYTAIVIFAVAALFAAIYIGRNNDFEKGRKDKKKGEQKK